MQLDVKTVLAILALLVLASLPAAANASTSCGQASADSVALSLFAGSC